MNEQKKTYEYWQQYMDEIWMGNMRMIHPGKDIEQASKEAFGYLLCDELRLMNAEPSDFKRLVNSFLINKRFPKTIQTTRFDLSKL
jgi:hypothetical protein